jgi:predicted TIM-barrel fold metal-dependent hydrolase
VHPHAPDAFEEIERATQDLGLVGIKLGPNYQNFDPVGPEAFKIYARAQELKLPILFHQGTSPVRFADLDYAHPRHMDRIATAFPDLKVVMAHVGHPWQIDTIVVIRKHPNVYADISANFYRPWSYYNELRLATEWAVLPKLLLGSDFPVATPRETIDSLATVNDIIKGTNLPEVPLGELEKIVDRNSLELLGLPY